MGAVSFSNVIQLGSSGNRRAVQADVTFSSSYATGGDTVGLAPLGLQHLYEVMESQGRFNDSDTTKAVAFTPNTHGLQVVLAGTASAPKLQVIAGVAGSGAQVANATNLSSIAPVHLEFRGV